MRNAITLITLVILTAITILNAVHLRRTTRNKLDVARADAHANGYTAGYKAGIDKGKKDEANVLTRIYRDHAKATSRRDANQDWGIDGLEQVGLFAVTQEISSTWPLCMDGSPFPPTAQVRLLEAATALDEGGFRAKVAEAINVAPTEPWAIRLRGALDATGPARPAPTPPRGPALPAPPIVSATGREVEGPYMP